ncbi:hypothetical protein [Bradyrhizobium sp. SRS-191]|uniref:hypothetical protein n=1 Tax=Bradyrhizobium sp. SRS-191 TaxID=2962606 RepID=UPI00211DF293|nr:hypothetical protein [Bradyrhizobium sp. SRS-191]
MNELIEPLARTAGIDGAVAGQTRCFFSEHLFIDHLLAQVLCNDKPELRFVTGTIPANDIPANDIPANDMAADDFAADDRLALELSRFDHDQTGTDQMIRMRLGTRGLNQFV